MPSDSKSLSNTGADAIPGRKSRELVERLSRVECPAITARRARRASEVGVDQDPIVWASGAGCTIVDVDGNAYLDFTSAFGVSAFGHSHPRLVEAISSQAGRLMHGMGDVYPTEPKIVLAERLADAAPGDLQESIFGLSGADAVEAALKTAIVATGRSGVIAFHGSYHGLSIGALDVTAYRDSFRAPFRGRLAGATHHLPYPYCYRCPLGLQRDTCGLACLELVRSSVVSSAAGTDDLGAVVVEPVQGRGGYIVPPEGWLAGLQAICNDHDLILIVDEILTGFGRTGARFAVEHTGVQPDVLCLGKAMTGGFPMSACIGSSALMASWGASRGEAIHTSTFLGNPMGCAAAITALDILDEEDLIENTVARGHQLRAGLDALRERHPRHVGEIRGLGLMQGLELVDDAARDRTPRSMMSLWLMRWLLEHGVLVLPTGVHGNVLALLPPLVVSAVEVERLLERLHDAFDAYSSGAGSAPS